MPGGRSPVAFSQYCAALRVANNRATATPIPLANAQVTASMAPVSGFSGLSGGLLPVTNFQPVVRIFLAMMVAAIVVTPPSTLQASLLVVSLTGVGSCARVGRI